MKIGLGLYRHMLTREYYDFARQAGCTHVVVHLVDYFNQGPSNPRNNQPTGSKYEPWGMAGDPDQLWTTRELKTLRAEIENAGLILAAIETAVKEAPAKPGKRLDLRNRPLLPRTGKPIDLSNDQIYDLIEFP